MSFAETNATYSANHFRGHQESATYSAYQVAQARTPPSRARASIVGMDSLAPLAHRMPYTAAFPKALGTGLLISTPRPIALELCAEIGRFIDEYEHVLSRFRADSLVARIGNAEHGGHFDFPDWAGPLFDLYDALHTATRGAIDPCVGEDLTRLGYGPAYTFAAQPNARAYTGTVHGRATWHGSVERHGCTLITRGPVSLDFGACGKGYAVDLIAALLRDGGCNTERNTERNADHHAGPNANRAADRALVIDAGGDLLVHLAQSPDQPVPLRVALEHPSDSTQAVGVAEIMDGALCASAPSRRHWGEQSGMRLHHLLNAIDGMPADSVAAAWAYVPQQAAFPCATADGLATALFVTPPDRLRARFRFECAFIDADGMLHASRDFPATLFLS